MASSENEFCFTLGEDANDFTGEYQREYKVDGELVVEPVDLTGQTVNLRLRRGDGCLFNIAGTIADALLGLFSFPFDTSALGEGVFDAQIEFTQPGGKLEIIPADCCDSITIRIEKGV